MNSRRRRRSQVIQDDEEDEVLSLEARKPPTKKPNVTTRRTKIETPKRSSSTTIASPKQIISRMYAPDINQQRELLSKDIKRKQRKDPDEPWIEDVLQRIPNATKVEVTASQTEKKDHIYDVFVKYEGNDGEECVLKLFADYSDGWAESVMIEKMQEICPEAAVGKITPIAHGPCIREIKNYGRRNSEPIVTYFAIFHSAGGSVNGFGEVKCDLEWPLQTLCVTIDSMLQSFVAADPKTSKFKFYHGDTFDGNYLLDVYSKSICMIDFGRSYFEWSDDSGTHCLTPLKEAKPQRTNDVLTFYNVIKKMLKLPNSAISEQDEQAWRDLTKFVSRRKSVNPIEEMNRFKTWCAVHGIALVGDAPKPRSVSLGYDEFRKRNPIQLRSLLVDSPQFKSKRPQFEN